MTSKKKPKLTPVPARRPVETPVAPEGAAPDAAPDLSHITEDLRPLAVLCSSIDFDPANVRRHDDANLAALRGSLRSFGQTKPIVARKQNGIVAAGNGTLACALALGWTHLAVSFKEMSEVEAARYSIADNQTSDLSTFDADALLKTLAALPPADDADLDKMLADLKAEHAPIVLPAAGAGGDEFDADKAAEGPCRVQDGDLWLIRGNGIEHRLYCGDCTDPASVLIVMDGQKASLMNTDPPYGVKLDLKANHEASNAAKGIEATYREFEPIEGDELTGEELQAFLEAAIRAAVPHLLDNAAFYLWHPMLTQGTFFAAAAAAAAADILIHRQIIWSKPHFIFGRGDYHWKHELCFYGWRKGHRPPFYGERNQHTVWALDEGGGSIRKDQGHPTQKPVELFVRPINNHTKPGELVYEPFAGSGSQFIAAHRTGRKCFGLEISPVYCSVILARCEAESLTVEKADSAA